MKKLFKHIYLIALSVATLTNVSATAAETKSQTSHSFECSKNLDIFNSVFKELDLFYVDTVNPAKAIKQGIDAMLSETDPYTVYFPESDMGDLKFMTTGAYAGVGAVISQTLDKKDVYITEVYEGMPAYKAGLKAGDVFVSIDGVNIIDKTTSEVSSMLRGEPFSTTNVVVKRKGVEKPLNVKVVRENVVIDPIPYYGMCDSKTGYIVITSFTDRTSASFANAFKALKQKGMQSLILDLRNNPGGLLTEATRVINMFVPQGSLLVYTKGKETQWNTKYYANEAPTDLTIPIVVLVNNNSASASEIVSGALQDLDRAVIFGDRTYGKGLVQTTRDLPYGGNLKVTISKYYIPSGRCIQAIDYAKRDANGRVKRIPDSLTNKFQTASGRIVYDGCGISPDCHYEEKELTPLIIQLMTKNVVFDYVTEYCSTHPTIPSLEDFKFEDYDGFKKFAKETGFVYKSKIDDYLSAFIDKSKEEGYYDMAKAQLDSLQARLSHNLDDDIDAEKSSVCKYISEEIARRYYYQKGAIMEDLKTDECVSGALNILKNEDVYRGYLSAKVVGEVDKKSEEKEESK